MWHCTDIPNCDGSRFKSKKDHRYRVHGANGHALFVRCAGGKHCRRCQSVKGKYEFLIHAPVEEVDFSTR